MMNDRNAKRTAWPSVGMSAADLLKLQYHVLLDVDLMTTAGFQVFYSEWVMGSLSKENCIFIQSLETDNIQIPSDWAGMKSLVFQSYEEYGFGMKRIGGSWLYITNNCEKAERIFRAARTLGIFIRVNGIDSKGCLQNCKLQNDRGLFGDKTKSDGIRKKVSASAQKERQETQKDKRKNGRFALPQQIYPIEKIAYMSRSVPAKRDCVYDSNHRRIVLGEEFISNPQSITYHTSLPEMQAKIYQKSWLQISYFKDKAEKMISNPVLFDGICWPKDMLYNECGEFVGILVPKAEGYQLKQELMSQAGLEAHFPEWSRLDLAHLTEVILEKIVYLQEENVIFGLINTGAIFVKDVDHVYFAEMDTYQIEGYPILSYERVMQAPELQDAENVLRLYNQQQDNYEIAMLTFMMLVPGKFPYNKGNNKDISESIKKMTFAFRYGERQDNEHGAREYFGLWRFVWSHLGNDLRRAFYFTFQHGQSYSLPEKRKNARFWLEKVKELEEELKHPYDVESLRIFPRTFKRYSGTQTIRCVKCGIDHPSFYYKYPEKRICNSCLGQPSDVHFVCRSCNKSYYYDFSTLFKYEKLVETKNFKMPTHCPYCRSDKERCKGTCGKMVPSYRLDRNGLCPNCAKEARERVVRRYRCKDCGKLIELTQGQVEFHEAKGLNLPVRCGECRKKRRSRY